MDGGCACRCCLSFLHLTDLLRQFARAATLRQKLQVSLAASPSHNILTPGKPVLTLTLKGHLSVRVATKVPFVYVT